LFSFSRCIGLFTKEQDYRSLFARSVSILKPMLNLPANFTLDLAIQKALGLRIFDAISHLAALASPRLHPLLESKKPNPSAPSLVVEVKESGLSACVSAGGLLVGRIPAINEINERIRPIFESSCPANHCPLICIHGMSGNGKSQLASRQLEMLQKGFYRSPPKTAV
jgi:hypothetical protein